MTLNGTQLELPYFIASPENVRQILSAVREADTKTAAVQDEDFHLFRQRHSRQPWRWEGAGRYAGIYSERNFATAAKAIADAEAKLSNPPTYQEPSDR